MIHPSISALRTSALCAVTLAVVTAALEAATIPYTNDFSGTGGNVDLPNEAIANPTAGDGFSISGETYNSFHSRGDIRETSGATIPITNADGVSFSMEVQFTVSGTFTSQTATSNTLGFSLFGNTGGNVTGTYYLADFAYSRASNSGTADGLLNVRAITDTSGVSSATAIADDNAGSTTRAVVFGTTYTLRLQGVYSSGTLDLSLGLWDATGTTQIGGTATATDTSPLTLDEFGLRHSTFLQSGSSPATISFDNLNIVPEPASATMFLFGLCAIAATRRYRAK